MESSAFLWTSKGRYRAKEMFDLLISFNINITQCVHAVHCHAICTNGLRVKE